jgi:hypothetical protein
MIFLSDATEVVDVQARMKLLEQSLGFYPYDSEEQPALITIKFNDAINWDILKNHYYSRLTSSQKENVITALSELRLFEKHKPWDNNCHIQIMDGKIVLLRILFKNHTEKSATIVHFNIQNYYQHLLWHRINNDHEQKERYKNIITVTSFIAGLGFMHFVNYAWRLWRK